MSEKVTKEGYSVSHRTIKGGRVYEHRVVAKAKRGQIVHHKNGNKLDNRPENLEVMSQSEHCKLHAPHIARWGRPLYTKCFLCGKKGRLRRGLCNAHYRRLKYYKFF